MKVPTIAPLLLALTAAPAVAGIPPVSLKLSDDAYATGDHAKVRVKTAEGGSLVVIQMDASRHVRVLYPLNPEDAGTIKGGHEMEIRGRGDREAFTVTESEGSGMVLAARSAQPFNFAAFARGSRWDLSSLAANNTADLTPEEVLLETVDRMTDAHYDYDAVTYTVGPRQYSRAYPMWGWGPWYPGYYYDPWFYPGFGLGLRFGGGFRHR